MASTITLSAGVRANLLSLQNTAQLMQTTQNRLATGKKVNSALDNPMNFFTSSSLSARASDLGNLLDAMGTGIQTIQAANNGLTAITSLVNQLQATVSQARGDSTAAAITPGSLDAGGLNNSTQTNNKLSFKLGNGVTVDVGTYNHVNATVSTVDGSNAIDATHDFSAGSTTGVFTVNDGTTTADIDMTSLDGTGTQQDVVDAINAGLQAAGSTAQASLGANNEVKIVNNTGKTITVGGTGAAGLGFGTGNTTSTDGSQAVDQALSIDQLVAAINGNSSLAGTVTASKDAATGHLKLANLTNNAITVLGTTGISGNVTGVASDSQSLAGGTGASLSSVRQSLLNQFNNLRTQLDKVAGDSGFNGINLLNGDKLSVKFNENGTSS